jgi:hypothetical protein
VVCISREVQDQLGDWGRTIMSGVFTPLVKFLQQARVTDSGLKAPLTPPQVCTWAEVLGLIDAAPALTTDLELGFMSL